MNLPERIWSSHLRTGEPDGYDEPAAPAHDRGHDAPQSVASNPTILRLRGGEVVPPFRPFTGSAQDGGGAAYQLHLVEQKYSWVHINQVACALHFFYGITLGQRVAFERIVTGKAPGKLPPVLNREEIARFLAVWGLRIALP